ncbi:MAG: GNAT family N-acetyltransferase [Chlamydiia bacterium]
MGQEFISFDLGNGFTLTEQRPSDRASLIEYLNQPEITRTMRDLPSPYTEEAADWWISHVDAETKSLGHPLKFAIRRSDGKLIGGIGFVLGPPGTDLPPELGYWLAPIYWNRGIVTTAVRRMCLYASAQLQLSLLASTVFEENVASHRVLQRAGFRPHARLPNFALKNGKPVAAVQYTLELKIGQDASP